MRLQSEMRLCSYWESCALADALELSGSDDDAAWSVLWVTWLEDGTGESQPARTRTAALRAAARVSAASARNAVS